MPNGTEVIFQVDTGSTVNVLPARFHPSDLPLNPVKKTLHAWNEGKVTALGTYRHTLRNTLNRKKYSIDFVIVKENFTPILGLKASTALKFVTINDDTFDRVASIKEDQYQEVFDRELGIIPGKHKLRVDPSIQPVVMPDRRVPIAVRPKLKEELDRMVSLGVITPVDEPTPWVSQLVITRKKSGALRVCIDPRELNRALLREHYTLPILEDTLHELSTSKLFTKADLSQGYWHIPLDYESSLLTAHCSEPSTPTWDDTDGSAYPSVSVFHRKSSKSDFTKLLKDYKVLSVLLMTSSSMEKILKLMTRT